ncbi:uncharacterized protein LOC128546363 [Mercenaria mercenaria]|uniref:uncharacterized protein LOC128546363 n=1 Tax=Mercenaria mercenaria TaxID=6596 RepID=UPI00234E93C9|nr:uncharacterized protein LOC128546363 [Mercenaria mercenaria]
MGKAMVAPSRGHTIPRLELYAAVLSVEIADYILKHLHVKLDRVRFFTDSRVVLGYICNRTRRFYTYISNRVERILRSSQPSQWSYVDTNHNPADVGTRGVAAEKVYESHCLKGPSVRIIDSDPLPTMDYAMQNPDEDKEVRPDVTTIMTKTLVEKDSLIWDPIALRDFPLSPGW